MQRPWGIKDAGLFEEQEKVSLAGELMKGGGLAEVRKP